MFAPLYMVVILLLFFECGLNLWLKARKYKDFPGSLGSPILGNLFQCITNYWHTWFSCYVQYMNQNIDRYGNLCCFWLCHKVNIAVCDPVMVEKIVNHPFISDKPQFVFNGMNWFIHNTFSYPQCDKELKLRRKELNNSLKKSSLVSYHASFIEIGKKTVDVLSQNTEQFDARPHTMLLSIEAIIETIFGLDYKLAIDRSLYEEIHSSSEWMTSSMINPFIKYLGVAVGLATYVPKRAKKMEQILYERVLNRALKIESEKEINEAPIAVTIALRNLARNTVGRRLMRELVELLYVGSHTIGTVLFSALVFLATNHHLQQKVWQEQHEIFDDSKREPTINDLRRMEYLGRFINETLRFVSPPAIFKEATADVEIDRKIIPKGTVVTINIYKMHIDNRFWDNPKAFDPDRFLPENIEKVPKYASKYFGFGLRSCPGGHYAIHMIKTILSAVARNLELDSKMNFHDIEYSPSLMMEIIGESNIAVQKRVSRSVGVQ